MSSNLVYKEPGGNCNVIFLYSQMTDKLLPDNPKADCPCWLAAPRKQLKYQQNIDLDLVIGLFAIKWSILTYNVFKG